MPRMTVERSTKGSQKYGAGAKRRKKLPPNKRGEAVMKSFEKGTLHSGGSKKIVTDPKQAKAIAYSESHPKKRR